MTNISHILTTEALQRYRKGELSEKEQQKVTEALQEDPFMADAFEGLQSMSHPDRLSDYTPVIDWNKHISPHHENRQRLLFMMWLQYAVALILLLLTWFAFLTIQRTIEKKENTDKNQYIVPTKPAKPNDTIRYFHLSPTPEK